MELQYIIENGQYKVANESDQYKILEITNCNLDDLQKPFDRYLSLIAIEHDLEYAQQYLIQMIFYKDTTLIDGSLMNSAIQLLIKCFTRGSGKGRSQLDPKKVFGSYSEKTCGKTYHKQYQNFLNIRRKTLAHDEENYKDHVVGLTVDAFSLKPIEVSHIKVRTHFRYKQNNIILKEMLGIALMFVSEEKQKLESQFLEHFKTKDLTDETKYQPLKLGAIDSMNQW